jgi:ADP-ribose pyrophosphatase YjhB (NUDIX family)
MDILSFQTNSFNGVMVDPQALPAAPDEFRAQLDRSLARWTQEGLLAVWLEIPISLSALIPVAVERGFVFHHSGQDYLMLTYRLAESAFIPPYATHYIGAGGVVINERHELLVVWEKVHRNNGRRYYKLPGGALRQGEHIVDGVMREIREETGIETRFESLVCFRHWHGYRFGKSDIYFVCRLAPLTEQIAIDEGEIQESLWMPVQEYMASEYVGVFNRRIVQAALEGPCMAPCWIEGYGTDPAVREIFMPANGNQAFS